MCIQRFNTFVYSYRHKIYIVYILFALNIGWLGTKKWFRCRFLFSQILAYFPIYHEISWHPGLSLNTLCVWHTRRMEVMSVFFRSLCFGCGLSHRLGVELSTWDVMLVLEF